MVRFLARNGVRLAYEEIGQRTSGAQTIVLIHGWTDRHELLLPMAKHFQGRYRVLAVDLRGHGQSDKPATGYQIRTLADDVAAICQHIGATRYHLVGHSLGGAVALEIAARYPDRVRSVSEIEGVIVVPAAFREGFKPLGEALRGPKWKEAIRGFIDSCYLPTDDPALRQYSHRELDRLPQHVHTGIYDAVMSWDAESAARAWKGPLLYIEGGSGLTDLTRLKTLCPALMVGQTIGIGHMQMIGAPAQVLPMLDRFLVVGGPLRA